MLVPKIVMIVDTVYFQLNVEKQLYTCKAYIKHIKNIKHFFLYRVKYEQKM